MFYLAIKKVHVEEFFLVDPIYIFVLTFFTSFRPQNIWKPFLSISKSKANQIKAIYT